MITNVTTDHTFGDGLELWTDQRPGYGYPVTDLTVNGLTVRHAGRQGITFGDVSGATLTDVAVLQAADSGIDFESDLPLLGSGNVTIANSTVCYCGARTSINSIDYLSGPVQLTNDTLAGHFVVENPQSANGFTMTGGSLALPRFSPGTPRPGSLPAGAATSRSSASGSVSCPEPAARTASTCWPPARPQSLSPASAQPGSGRYRTRTDDLLVVSQLL